MCLSVADVKGVEEDTQTVSKERNITKPEEPKSSSSFYRCCVCNKDYPNMPYLVRHIKYHISRKKVSHCERCSHCDKSFTTKQQLVRHESSHQDVRPFQCDQCKKFFKTADSVKRHMYVHSDEKPFSCHICHKDFKAKHLMKKHEETHSDAKNYECPKCGKKFKARNSLRDHLLVHNGTRPYKCEECNQAFYRRSHLATHKTVHSEIKPFSCNVCDKSFGRREHLKVHQRIHSGERPFHCNQCDRSFNQQAGLQAHLVSHSDERPYTCLKCKKSFKYQSQIKHHACKPDVIGPCMVNVHDNFCTREEENCEQTPPNTPEVISASEDFENETSPAPVDISNETSETENTIILIQIENTPHADEAVMSVDIETVGTQETAIPGTNVQLILSEAESEQQNIKTISKDISERRQRATSTQAKSKRKASATTTSQTEFSHLSSNIAKMDIPETRVILTETRVEDRHGLDNMTNVSQVETRSQAKCVNITSDSTKNGSTQEKITGTQQYNSSGDDTYDIVGGTRTHPSGNEGYVTASPAITLEKQSNKSVTQLSSIGWSHGGIATVANDARTAERGAMQLPSYQFQQPVSFEAETAGRNQELQSGSPPPFWNQR